MAILFGTKHNILAVILDFRCTCVSTPQFSCHVSHFTDIEHTPVLILCVWLFTVVSLTFGFLTVRSGWYSSNAVALEFFLNGADVSLNSVNSEKLINH